MKISELSVRRPVFATVLSLLLVLIGLASAVNLAVREYPDIDPPIVSIDTNYRGASAEVIETRVTQLIEDQVAGLEGIVKLTSNSRDGRSSVDIEFALTRNVDEAANDVRDRVGRVLSQLPAEADPPRIAKSDSDTQPVMWLTFTSDRHSTLELTDIAERMLIDRFSVVEGVARVSLSGARRYAMRIWLDREAMAARGVTAEDITAALRRENVELPAGRLESSQREFTLRTRTGLVRPDDFAALVIDRGGDGNFVRLGDVAEVRIGAEDERSIARANLEPAISLGIEQQSKANTVDVSRGIRAAMEEVAPSLPDGVQIAINFDRATFIEASMNEVVKALGFALTLVLLVIYLFLGNVRATLVPAVTIPICVIATFSVMALFGYSINVLILLGLVLAIGLVVDDAIVVLENIWRRVENGEPPLLAAVEGSKEIGFAVVATTLVLVSVFLPISFIQGNVGRLFREFGVAVAAAVTISSLVALTLIPMLSSKLFKSGQKRGWLTRHVEAGFQRMGRGYRRALGVIVPRPWAVIALALLVTVAAAGLFRILPSEYAPREDRGIFFTLITAPSGASIEYTEAYAERMEEILMRYVDNGEAHRVLLRVPGGWGGGGGVDSARAIVLLEDWSVRKRSVEEIAAEVRAELSQLPGVQARVITPAGLGVRGADRPVQMVLGGAEYSQLAALRDELMAAAEGVGGLRGLDSNYEERQPQMRVVVDRNRAAELGVSLENIGRTLETVLGSREVTTFIDRGREYNVILQGLAEGRATPSDLSNIYVRSATSGMLVPLGNLVSITERAGPSQLRRFDRLRSITVSAGLEPGASLGESLDTFEELARSILPPDVRISWDGESREFKESGGSLYITFVMALIVVFLVLAAQFESFRHPLVIMFTVPLAITGALLGLWAYGGSINVYSQIGLIMLVGLAAKNGVLIVEFANQLRDRGMAFEESIIEAAAIRLRPVLMTSACTAIGALPLLLATGAGSESRQAVGIVVVYGMTLTTFLTLFVVPAAYSVIARNTKSPGHVGKKLARLRAGRAPDAA
ncbi:efflux RND transporter permease subunit [Wenzhouxiangella sp. XN24]|uniref:efflux RND transporter permease subunit n=1 Tax=Wenzhouxiangella sp. XN24 TaxID=2713569 RepID=UPI0013EDA1A2|nr:efflux RND transporter permease subunit [Wenzhouxiangella sp. XN24]